MDIKVRSCTGRFGTRPIALLAAGCALGLGLTGCGRPTGTAAAAAPAHTAYTLMQMNLCLSGLAGCYPKVRYPTGVSDAIARVRQQQPDAVTLNEACSGDVALIARRTGYQSRFSRVIYSGRPLPCIHPGGRGLFGDAVLTRAGIERAAAAPFASQAGPEERQWLCLLTRGGVQVCTAHLASHEPIEAAANAPQCTELTAVLARRASSGTVIFGGDVNRLSSCAPRSFWTRTDTSAHQNPGSQQVYGTRGLRSPSVRVTPTTHTDHDVLVVRAQLRSRSRSR